MIVRIRCYKVEMRLDTTKTASIVCVRVWEDKGGAHTRQTGHWLQTDVPVNLIGRRVPCNTQT